jgi:hypothetical protein
VSIKSQESRRNSLLLAQRRVSGVAMVLVLGLALLCGLIGFAAHIFWVAAVIVLALGLGYVFANARQDRKDVVERREDEVERSG